MVENQFFQGSFYPGNTWLYRDLPTSTHIYLHLKNRKSIFSKLILFPGLFYSYFLSRKYRFATSFNIIHKIDISFSLQLTQLLAHLVAQYVSNGPVRHITCSNYFNDINSVLNANQTEKMLSLARGMFIPKSGLLP